ncbi:PTS glucose transporter subunit IIA [Ligilactobacillus sp. Marseille-Q7487]|jgi:PTS system glucose-specific IIA component|uniref:PTS sugar transporter subunit IIA n=1 Tax=Ligilactobacillus sp. Marseille-Q7487 TaxID=3022128 RepID=UPI0015B38BAD|nr:PTS glucose transporter subunit IIA [Ligilactobacillus sp. Marseille-Q7487]
MFGLLKKKKKIDIFSPVDGQIIELSKVEDEVFSQKLMGDGFGVIPTSDDIYAPIDGEVISIFPTKHAITLKNAEGIEVLLHLGLDTVELKGAPFEVKVTVGQKVTSETLLVKMNREEIKNSGKQDTVLTIFTSQDKINDLNIVTQNITHSNICGDVVLK